MGEGEVEVNTEVTRSRVVWVGNVALRKSRQRAEEQATCGRDCLTDVVQ